MRTREFAARGTAPGSHIGSAVVVLLLTVAAAAAQHKPIRTQENAAVEIAFQAGRPHADPFNEVTLDVEFAEPSGVRRLVPAFWDGGNAWKARYASGTPGTHRYRSVCSDTTDEGLHGVTGSVEVAPYAGKNPLLRHGPLKVAPDRRHLQHEDGTPFFWLGDTWWMGLAKRLQWPDEFQELACDRKQKGFTVVQIVAGLYPDMPAFDPRGANEAGFPWEAGYARIRPEYFDMADQRIQHLVDQGMVPCIVGAWGYFIPWMGVDKMKQHWRYLIARYGAWPVTWCVAGEANLPWYLAKGFPYDERQAVREWTEVIRFVRRTDPFHRLVTIHPTALGPYTSRHATDDDGLLDFDMLQTPHGRAEAVPITVKAARDSYIAEPTMPVIDGEASYEMLLDLIESQWTRAMFWFCMMNGAAGHTYGANGIWQNNRPGDPHGNSPTGGTYGKITWREAMQLPGSTQVALGKRVFERYPWQKLEPHPEWVAYADDALLGFEGSRWIWYPEGDPGRDAPVDKRCLRGVLEVPEGARVIGARLRVSADDSATVMLNGETLGATDNWHVGAQFDVTGRLSPGRNAVAILAENRPAPVTANPAGAIARVEARLADGKTLTLVSDALWRGSREVVPGWDAPGFDDSAWPHAMEIGAYGCSPWGSIGAEDPLAGPQSCGIPASLRLTYVLQPRPIALRSLGSGATYKASVFDPVTGATTALPDVRADEEGGWTCRPPSGWDHDWVLILEAQELGAQPVRSAERRQRAARSREAGSPSAGQEGPLHETHIVLTSDALAWHLDWRDGRLRTRLIENRLAGHAFAVSGGPEVSLTFSAAADRVTAPVVRVDDLRVLDVSRRSPGECVARLRSDSPLLDVTVRYDVIGPLRRKSVEVTNRNDTPLRLLDVGLDDLRTDGAASGGGAGEPAFLGEDTWAGAEHPAGESTADGGRVRLAQYPGCLLAPGQTYRTKVAVVGVARPGHAREAFLAYLREHARRRREVVSVYTPFGINNQWGAAPTLDDEQALEVLGLLAKWQRKGVGFDYFTLDTGWSDPSSDLTRFRMTAFPNGPKAVSDRVHGLGMRFGLWFPMGWGTQSCWDYPGAYADGQPPGLPFREGYPVTVGGLTFCLGDHRYFRILKDAVLHHVRENGVRFLKFDGGLGPCDRTDHNHLPGRYSLEPLYDRLIDIADGARAVAPDTFVMWYWGLRSPFWALYGDTIFESGLHMEGSGTSSMPALYYRDSVTLAQDQNARHARLVPPIVKDSLGVWLADTRWGNFMVAERWREALVMDLGRGSLLFPNLWGDLYHLTDDDTAFLARMQAFAKEHAGLLLETRRDIGDPWKPSPYGYAYGHAASALLFLNNPHFASRPVDLLLDGALGLEVRPGAPVFVAARFPDREVLAHADGSPYRAGERLTVWLRPFEVLLLEFSARTGRAPRLPRRTVAERSAADLGRRLALHAAAGNPRLEVQFADAARFAERGFQQKATTLSGTLPALEGDQPMLAVAVRLRQGGAEWRYAPKPVEIVQAVAYAGGRQVQLVPVPDGRQFGNTQAAGCSWVVYKSRIDPSLSGKPLEVVVHAFLPPGVEANVEVWLVRRWWKERTRPTPDGYYTDAPS